MTIKLLVSGEKKAREIEVEDVFMTAEGGVTFTSKVNLVLPGGFQVLFEKCEICDVAFSVMKIEGVIVCEICKMGLSL